MGCEWDFNFSKFPKAHPYTSEDADYIGNLRHGLAKLVGVKSSQIDIKVKVKDDLSGEVWWQQNRGLTSGWHKLFSFKNRDDIYKIVPELNLKV